MEKNKWKTALVTILFKKLKGCVKTETGKRMVRPGEHFMILSDNARGTWIGLCDGPICRDATAEEIARLQP